MRVCVCVRARVSVLPMPLFIEIATLSCAPLFVYLPSISSLIVRPAPKENDQYDDTDHVFEVACLRLRIRVRSALAKHAFTPTKK